MASVLTDMVCETRGVTLSPNPRPERKKGDILQSDSLEDHLKGVVCHSQITASHFLNEKGL